MTIKSHETGKEETLKMVRPPNWIEAPKPPIKDKDKKDVK
jgi:hypothetical protein